VEHPAPAEGALPPNGATFTAVFEPSPPYTSSALPGPPPPPSATSTASWGGRNSAKMAGLDGFRFNAPPGKGHAPPPPRVLCCVSLLIPPPPLPPTPSALPPPAETEGPNPLADGSSSEEEQSESDEEKAIMMGHRSTKVTIVPHVRGTPQMVHTADLEDLIVANTNRQHKEVMVAIKNLFGLDNKPIPKTFAGYQATILHLSKRFDAPLSLKVLFLPSDLTPCA
jgi:hypothetical protein